MAHTEHSSTIKKDYRFCSWLYVAMALAIAKTDVEFLELLLLVLTLVTSMNDGIIESLRTPVGGLTK